MVGSVKPIPYRVSCTSISSGAGPRSLWERLACHCPFWALWAPPPYFPLSVVAPGRLGCQVLSKGPKTAYKPVGLGAAMHGGGKGKGPWFRNGDGGVSTSCVSHQRHCPDGAPERKAVSVRCFTSSEVIIMLHPLVAFRLFRLFRVIHRRGLSSLADVPP